MGGTHHGGRILIENFEARVGADNKRSNVKTSAYLPLTNRLVRENSDSPRYFCRCLTCTPPLVILRIVTYFKTKVNLFFNDRLLFHRVLYFIFILTNFCSRIKFEVHDRREIIEVALKIRMS